jgi:hypothetical protein
MAQEAEASSGRVIGRLAYSGEDTARKLVALPLRIFAEALGIFEAIVRTAADAVGEGDPIDERFVDLERRVDSLEQRAIRRREGSGTSTARQRTPKGADTAVDEV